MDRKTSIIILTYNNLAYTKDCLNSIKKYTKKGSYEVIIVDNNSTDGTKQFLESLENKYKVIFNDENKGFPKACNQGIKFAEKNNDILLLNNDTIVTSNWLENLKICLNSSSLIGAVGAVSNNDENRQGVNFTYDNFEMMQELAKKNNITDSSRWEEKNFLIGYCLLIKRNVINKLGFLDENFTPGYIEDNDLCLRIISLGYKLMLCHDVFIHHYLGTSFRQDLSKFYPILYKNRSYFKEKWHFETLAFDEIKSLSFPLIVEPKKVLEINSSIGSTILYLKYLYKDILVEGVERNNFKRQIGTNFAKVYKQLDDVKDVYDYILLGDILKRIKNPAIFLAKLKNYLTKDGFIVGELPNIYNVKNINKLLKEEVVSFDKNVYSKKALENLLLSCGFQDVTFYSWYETLNQEEIELLKALNNNEPNNLMYTNYTFKAKKVS